MVFVTYAPVLTAGFIWDDEENVVTNGTLRTLDGLRQMWLVPQSIQQYYPLMYTSYWLEYHLWGLSPLGYHLVNVVLHAAAVLLVWRLLLRLQVPGAWLAAALFAVHPVIVESVAWVTERKNVLSLSLALASLLCYFRFAPPDEHEVSEAPQTTRRRWLCSGAGSVRISAVGKDGRRDIAAGVARDPMVETWTRDTSRLPGRSAVLRLVDRHGPGHDMDGNVPSRRTWQRMVSLAA